MSTVIMSPGEIAPAEGPRWITLPGGEFWAGSDDFYPDEAPVRRQRVSPFRLGAAPVTNRQFAVFVAATGYVTLAERALSSADFPQLSAADRAPGSLVFTPTAGPVDLRDWRQWWRWAPGASWQRPRGPEIPEAAAAADLADHPVVQVAYADAQAYAEWVGGRLPSEAELEYAACGGARPDPYAWGEDRDPGGRIMANTWRGRFPYRNDGANGWVGTSPVGAFPANAFGLYDSIGNVWEWTSDRYGPPQMPRNSCGCGSGGAAAAQTLKAAQPPHVSEDPENDAPAVPSQRVLKGGSHLCAPEYCLRYRPAARSPQAEDSATTHIGFRVARDPE